MSTQKTVDPVDVDHFLFDLQLFYAGMSMHVPLKTPAYDEADPETYDRVQCGVSAVTEFYNKTGYNYIPVLQRIMMMDQIMRDKRAEAYLTPDSIHSDIVHAAANYPFKEWEDPDIDDFFARINEYA